MKKLIINADDYGYCKERNEGIAKLLEEGVVTSASFLINLEGQQHALSLLSRLRASFLDGKSLPIGLHLNFTEGKPISKLEEIPSLVNSEGVFFGKFGFREELEKGKVDLKHIEIETRAQIEWFRKNCGQNPSHIDGHNHAHVLPQLVPTLSKVFKDESITLVRIPHEPNLSEQYPWLQGKQLQFLQEVCNNALEARKEFEKNSIFSSKYFIGLGLMGSNATMERIKKTLSEISDGVVEWMVHPEGKGDDFSYSNERELELENLRSLKSELSNFGIVLTSWNGIKE